MRLWTLIAADLVVLLFSAVVHVPLALTNLDDPDDSPLQAFAAGAGSAGARSTTIDLHLSCEVVMAGEAGRTSWL